MHLSSAVPALLSVPLLAAPAAAGDLFVGPPGSAAPFHEIAEAIAAASPGDTIHVAAGAYDVFTVDAPLRIVGEGSGVVRVRDFDAEDGVVITGVGAGESAVLSGLTILEAKDVSAAVAASQLLVDACAGQVILHDVRVLPVPGGNFVLRPVQASAVGALLVQDCRFEGETEDGSSFFGGVPLTITASRAWVSDTTLLAGHNAPVVSEIVLPFSGAPGLSAESQSEVTVSRCLIRGGDGANNLAAGGSNEAGGPGIQVSASTVHLAGGAGNLIAGGHAGTVAELASSPGGAGVYSVLTGNVTYATDVVFAPGLGSTGAAAADVVQLDDLFGAPAGVTTPLASRRATLAVSPPQVGLGGAFTLELAGNPSAIELPFLAVAPGAPIALPGADGALLLNPLASASLGGFVLDASGQAAIELGLPPDPALSGRIVLLQSLEVATGYLGFSNPGVFAVAP